MKQKINENAQVSLEFLMVLAVFFSALLIIFPVIIFSTNNLKEANDALLAKLIFTTINKEINLFEFLANGSEKRFEFNPTESITLKQLNNELKISSNKKIFIINFNSKNNFEKSFSKKFFINLKKENDLIKMEIN